MNFKNHTNEILSMLFLILSSFLSGMTLEDKFNLPEYVVLIIGIGVYILSYIIYRLRISFNPLRRIERKIRKLAYKHQQLKMFFDEYIPETKKTLS